MEGAEREGKLQRECFQLDWDSQNVPLTPTPMV